MTVAGLAEPGMSRRQLQRLQDARRYEPHPWAGWTTADLATAIAHHPVRGHLRGLRLRPQLMKTLDRHVDALRRLTHATGPLYIGTLERVILEAGREDRGNRQANYAQGRTTLYNRLRDLEAIGALRWGHYERRDAGHGGIWVELLTPTAVALPVELQGPAADSSGALGRLVCTQRHRRQTSRQRREGRYAPYKRRWDAPPRRDFEWTVPSSGPHAAFSRDTKLDHPYGASRGSAPTGPSPREAKTETAVRGRAESDARSRPGAASGGAAVMRRTAGIDGEASAALVSAARRGDPPVPLVLAAWRLLWPDRAPRLSPQRRCQLERDVDAFDRVTGEGAGAAVLWVFERMVEQRRGKEPPASVGLFIAQLRSATASAREAWRLAREADGRRYRRAARRRAARQQRHADRIVRLNAELDRRNAELPWLT